jgi:hypothetical protein
MISDADKQQFFKQGYLVVPNVVPQAHCDAAVAAICRYLHVDLDDPATWYTTSTQGHGIVPVHHDPAFWSIRQLPTVHQVFSRLYGTDALWVSMDRASFKPPADGWSEQVYVDPIHWDGDPRTDTPLSIQGLIYLMNTEIEQGGFCCVPQAFENLPEFLNQQTSDALATMRPDIDDMHVNTVAAPAGSLVLWNRRMPHTSTANQANRPRLTQYVGMELTGDEEQRLKRVELFHSKRPPAWAVRQQIADQQIPEIQPDIALSELGRRLVGIDRW